MQHTRHVLSTVLATLAALCVGALLARGEDPRSEVLPGPFSLIHVVDFDTDIEPVLSAYVKREIEDAKAGGAECVVLRIHSPGGTVQDSQEIGDYLLEQDDLHVVAWVPKKAYSGAAMVALSCDEIIMGRDAHMGDAQPIYIKADGIQPVGEKAETVMRAKMRNYATRNGYPPVLAEAMVSERMEVLRVRDPLGGLHFVEGKRYRDTPDDVELFGARKSDLKQVGLPVIREEELLTLTADEAREYDFLARRFEGERAFPRDEDEVIDALKAEDGRVVFVQMSFSDRASRVLLSLMGLLAGVVVLATTLTLWRGFGTITIVGIAALVLAVLIGATAGQLHGFPILLIVLGILLLGVEVFLLPGFGIAGVLGFVTMGAGFLFLGAGATIGDTGGLTTDLLVRFGSQFLLTVLVGMVLLLALSRFFPSIGPGRRLMLAAPEAGSVEATPVVSAAVRVGDRGRATSTLRPAGSAEFSGRLVDVATRGTFVSAGAHVEIVAVEGNRVTVKALEGTEDGEQA